MLLTSEHFSRRFTFFSGTQTQNTTCVHAAKHCEVTNRKGGQFWAWDFSQLEKSPFLHVTWLCETELPDETAVIAGDV